MERQKLNVDIVCVGFGPAMGGFLSTLSRGMLKEDGTPISESKAMPGMPPQVICYERADDLAFGVSGVVTRGEALREDITPEQWTEIPMATRVTSEKVVYLMDPLGASRRSALLRIGDCLLGTVGKWLPWVKNSAMELPWVPDFLEKRDGYLFSIGQFNQWVANQVMGSGLVQVWASSPVERVLLQNGRVSGVRLCDQGVDLDGKETDTTMPGMDVEAALTVIGDGAIGAVGRGLDEELDLPEGHEQDDWAVGMKMVVDLPENSSLKPGAVLHTFGYPEPEIFGFLYVHPGNIASFGIFVPSWMKDGVQTPYQYLQHWMKHPYLWQHLQGAKMRSWGAKSLQEAGRRGEPFLVGDGFARIGEGSGATNVLTNSGVDEAYSTGVMLGESVLELLRQGKDFSKKNLEETYLKRRRESELDRQSRIAEKARDGFHYGLLTGMVGMFLCGVTQGKLFIPKRKKQNEKIRQANKSQNRWEPVEYDGALLMSHQDALLLGGKVQAMPGYANHVRFTDRENCRACLERTCITNCSGQAITPGEDGLPTFDKDKCVHCGACSWSCTRKDNPGVNWRICTKNLKFRAGSGGLHSAEN